MTRAMTRAKRASRFNPIAGAVPIAENQPEVLVETPVEAQVVEPQPIVGGSQERFNVGMFDGSDIAYLLQIKPDPGFHGHCTSRRVDQGAPESSKSDWQTFRVPGIPAEFKWVASDYSKAPALRN